jgi:hypothetical protein
MRRCRSTCTRSGPRARPKRTGAREVIIESTRTFATGADGGALSRQFAAIGNLPRTPVPGHLLVSKPAVDDLDQRWLAESGIDDSLTPPSGDAADPDPVASAWLRASGIEDAFAAAAVAQAVAQPLRLDGFVP